MFCFCSDKEYKVREAHIVIMEGPCLTALGMVNGFLLHEGSAGAIHPYTQHATDNFFLSLVH